MMKKLIRPKLLLLMGLFNAATAFTQSKIKDNSISGTSPYAREGALLELESNNKGVLMPRISLTSTTAWGLSGTDTAGMMVYNNNAALSGSPAAPALSGGIGFYYWDGGRWVGMSSGPGAADFWQLSGNTATTPPATVGTTAGTANYWGTADAKNLAIGTNATTRAIVDQAGNLYGGNNSIARGGAENTLVWGAGNTDSAAASLITGTNNTIRPSANNSIAAGSGNTISSTSSAVFGTNNQSSGISNLASGGDNIITGQRSIVVGNSDTVAGSSNAVFGQSNRVRVDVCLISGERNMIVGGRASVVFGQENVNREEGIFGSGLGNLTSGYRNANAGNNCGVLGTQNWMGGGGGSNFIVGNQDTVTNYAFANLVSGSNNKVIRVNGARASIISGESNTLTDCNSAAAFGGSHSLNSVSGTLVSGYNNTVPSGGDLGIVTGTENYLGGVNAAVFGQRHKDSAGAVLVAGYNNTLTSSANGSIVTGGNNYVLGNHSAVFGQGHSDSANYTMVMGQNNIVSTGMHHAVVTGSYNAPLDGGLLVVGNGSAANRSNAFVVTGRQSTGATGAGQTNGILIMSASLPKYTSISNANADPSLPSGAFFKIAGAVYQKD